MRYTAIGLAALLLAGCGGDGDSPRPPTGPAEPGFGSIEVVVSTTGGILDDDGYIIYLSHEIIDDDGTNLGTVSDSMAVGTNDTITLRKWEGRYSVGLVHAEVADQCTPSAWSEGLVVSRDQTTEVILEVICDPVVPPANLWPRTAWTVPQNNPGSRCPYHDTAGYGFWLKSYWTPARSDSGIKEYELVIERRSAPNITLVNTRLPDTTFVYRSCGYYADQTAGPPPHSALPYGRTAHYGSWRVRVRALDNAGNWSKETENWFALGYCRLSDGTPCS